MEYLPVTQLDKEVLREFLRQGDLTASVSAYPDVASANYLLQVRSPNGVYEVHATGIFQDGYPDSYGLLCVQKADPNRVEFLSHIPVHMNAREAFKLIALNSRVEPNFIN